MSRQVKTGDLAYITQGALGPNGPNTGKIITVGKLCGEHSLHGPIYLIHSNSNDLITEYGAVGNIIHAAQDWLKLIDPDSINSSEVHKELVNEN